MLVFILQKKVFDSISIADVTERVEIDEDLRVYYNKNVALEVLRSEVENCKKEGWEIKRDEFTGNCFSRATSEDGEITWEIHTRHVRCHSYD